MAISKVVIDRESLKAHNAGRPLPPAQPGASCPGGLGNYRHRLALRKIAASEFGLFSDKRPLTRRHIENYVECLPGENIVYRVE